MGSQDQHKPFRLSNKQVLGPSLALLTQQNLKVVPGDTHFNKPPGDNSQRESLVPDLSSCPCHLGHLHLSCPLGFWEQRQGQVSRSSQGLCDVNLGSFKGGAPAGPASHSYSPTGSQLGRAWKQSQGGSTPARQSPARSLGAATMGT